MPELSRLNPDNLRIGENLRAALERANPTHARTGLTWRSLAKGILHHVVLARAVAGTGGLSEEKILALAERLGTHPGNLILGVSAQAKAERFPHIPAPTNRNKRDVARKGMAVSSVEALVKNPRILSAFFGGIAKENLQIFIDGLLELRRKAALYRSDSTTTCTVTIFAAQDVLPPDHPAFEPK